MRNVYSNTLSNFDYEKDDEGKDFDVSYSISKDDVSPPTFKKENDVDKVHDRRNMILDLYGKSHSLKEEKEEAEKKKAEKEKKKKTRTREKIMDLKKMITKK